MTRITLVLCCLSLALSLVAGCDKDATRDDEQPTAQPSSTPAGEGGDKAEGDKAGDKAPAEADAGGDAFDHSRFDGLLETYVSDDGLVKYKAWKASEEDMKALDAYLDAIAKADLSKLSKDEQLAFWINGYNAYALKGILAVYPVDSVMKIEGLENGEFFKKPKHKIAGMELTLDQIENEKIRKEFEEPRIHFVLNCTAMSCPKIRKDALTAENMDEEMEAAAKAYINSDTKIDKGEKTVSASKIFKWFKGDFTKGGKSLNDYLARYIEDTSATEVVQNAKITHHEYDWALNEAR